MLAELDGSVRTGRAHSIKPVRSFFSASLLLSPIQFIVGRGWKGIKVSRSELLA